MKYFYLLALPVSVVMLLMAAVVSDAVVYRGNPLNELMRSPLFDEAIVKDLTGQLTAYCPGPCCNTAYIQRYGRIISVDWSNQVAGGNFSIGFLHARGVNLAAVDPAVIPLGSILIIDNHCYIALDVGRAIRGNRIDISLPTHEKATLFGRRTNDVRVYIPSDPSASITHLKHLIEK